VKHGCAAVSGPGISIRAAGLLGAVVVAAAVSMAVVGCGGDRGGLGCVLRSVDEAAYVAKNEEVFAELPVLPRSKFVNTFSIGQPAPHPCIPTENSPPYDAFVTTHVYRSLNDRPPGAVVRFYRRQLAPTWKLVAYSLPPPGRPPADGTFRRGAASVYVAEYQGGWEISVDHGAYR
jgi:hypothetical protein